jgi:Pectate lyase superfamily protein
MVDTKLSALTQGTIPPTYWYGEQGGTSQRFSGDGIINVMDYGAVGNNVHDDTVAIQAAFTAAGGLGGVAGADGGTTVFFPPGTYKVISTVFIAAAGNQTSIKVLGAGKGCTLIQGSVTGYVLSAPSNGLTSQQHQFTVLSDLSITNTNLAAGNGCFFAGYIDNNAAVRDCIFEGFIGINIGGSAAHFAGSFGGSVENCWFVSGLTPGTSDQGRQAFPSGNVGAYIGQGTMTNCRFQNWNIAIAVSEQAGAVIGCDVEVSDMGIAIGKGPDGVTGIQAFELSTFQTEDVNSAIVIFNGAGCTIANCTLTGQRNPTIPAAIAGAVWSGGNLATIQTTLNHNLGAVNSTHSLYLEFNGYAAGTGWLAQGQIRTCTVTDATHFTYSLTVNPGAFNAGAGNDWNYINSVGIQVNGTFKDSLITSILLTLGADIVMDLNNSGFASATNCTIMNVQGGGNWAAPPAVQKASYQYINCGQQDAVGLSGPGIFGMNFADLPGQSGVFMSNAYEGMEYSIGNATISLDANSHPILGSTVTGGGTSHAKVRYNGTNWTLMGA